MYLSITPWTNILNVCKTARSFIVKLFNIEKLFAETFCHPYIKWIICAGSNYNFSVLLIIYWPSGTRKNYFFPVFQLLDMLWSYNLNGGYPLTNEVGFWSINNMQGEWPKWQCHVSSPFIRVYRWSKLRLHFICGHSIYFSLILFKLRFLGGVHNSLLNHLCAKSFTY